MCSSSTVMSSIFSFSKSHFFIFLFTGSVITSIADQQQGLLDNPIEFMREIQGCVLALSGNLTNLDVLSDTLIRNLTTETSKISLLQELFQNTSIKVATFGNRIDLLNYSIYNQILPDLINTAEVNKTLQALDQQVQTNLAPLLAHVNGSMTNYKQVTADKIAGIQTAQSILKERLDTAVSDQIKSISTYLSMLWNQTDAQTLELKSNLTRLSTISTQTQGDFVDLAAQFKALRNSLQIISTTFETGLDRLKDNFTEFQHSTSLQLETLENNQSYQNNKNCQMNTTMFNKITTFAYDIEALESQVNLQQTAVANMNMKLSEVFRNLTVLHPVIEHTFEQNYESVYRNLSDEVKNLSLSIHAAEERWVAMSEDLMLRTDYQQ